MVNAKHFRFIVKAKAFHAVHNHISRPKPRTSILEIPSLHKLIKKVTAL